MYISGVASGYSRYSVNTLQFPEKIIICIMLHYVAKTVLFLKCSFKWQI